MDWRKAGEEVRARGRRFFSEFAKNEFKPHNDKWRVAILTMPADWLAAVFGEAFDPRRFDYRQWLQSHPSRLNQWDEPPKNGRPLGTASRAAASLACCFYETWHTENQKQGISDYGRRREMKDFAAQAVVEDIFALQFIEPKLNWQFGVEEPALFVDIVRDLMDKPKRRRDPGSHASFEFLASPDELLLSLPPKPPENT